MISFESTTVFTYFNTYLEFSSQILTNHSDAQLAKMEVMYVFHVMLLIGVSWPSYVSRNIE